MKTKTFDIEEFSNFILQLQKSGWEPKVCNTEVRLYDSEVPCGTPDEVNNSIFSMVSLPQDMVGDYPIFMVRAKGDSMVDLGINHGDTLLVENGKWPQDGDTVLAYVNGEVTIKTFFTASDGTHWLVPNNEKKNYKAIPIDDTVKVNIGGIVLASFKKSVRASFRKCEQIVKQTRQVDEPEPEISEQKVSYAIRTIAGNVSTKRQWYSVYVMLVNYNVIKDEDFYGFCERVKLEVPNHQNLPTVTELQRMAVMSFVKPVRLWSEDYAPVTGKRFKDYKNIALETERLLLQK